MSSSYEAENLKYFQTVFYEEIETLSKQIERDLNIDQAIEINPPIFRIKCNNSYLEIAKILLNECISSKIVELFPYIGDYPVFEEQSILDELNTIEKRTRCIIIPKKVDCKFILFYLLKNYIFRNFI